MNDVWNQQALHAKSVPGFLTPEECEKVKNDALAIGMARATMYTPQGLRPLKMRTNFHARLPRNDQNEWLYARVMAQGREINEEFWRFAIDGIDEIQVLRYQPMQRIDWHFDTAAGYHRKIACVVTLSPPESHWRGELEIVGRHDNKSEAPLQGAATWFPTYLRHRATRPWWGERWSFVAWLTGPDWV